MVDPRHHAAPAAPPAAAGFTLAEMLAALGILLLGVTALLGALTASIAQRRTTDARLEAAALCEHAVHRIRAEATQAGADLDLHLVALDDQTAPGFQGMTWSAEATVDIERPDVWLVTLQVRWLEQGETVIEQFRRVLPRELPFGRRVQAFRDGADAAR
jgi:Tfp pilus assembly protein PilV